jgi:hypothetical protein
MSGEPKPNPFPGLRPFDTGEGHLFFGRGEESRDLVARLRRERFLAVVGTSGSGKSSLVRAGLVPQLEREAETAADWCIAAFRPGENPIKALALALDADDVLGRPGRSEEEKARDATLLEVRLRRSGLGLIEVVRLARLEPQRNLMLLIDQFEELFRFAAMAENQSDAAAFVKLILEATRQGDRRIHVVLTMRSDFIGDCSRFRDLPEAVAAGLYLIPRLTRRQRRNAIEEPVRLAGADIAQRLVNRVLNDIGEDPDQLPVMQHALMRTWEQWRARASKLTEEGSTQLPPLDLDDYQAIGGAANALSKHAEEAYGELDAKGRYIAQRMFQSLTEKGADNREIRRPTRLATIAEMAGATIEEVGGVVEAFRRGDRSFLMPPANVPLEGGTAIDISHESLIRHWQRLASWVEEEADSAKTYRHLAETAALHEKGRAGLWGDPDLADCLNWQERIRPTKAWAERYQPGFEAALGFLDASRSARDAALRQRRWRWRVGIAAVVLIVAGLSGLSTVALIERHTALQKEGEANEARQAAVQKEEDAYEARDAAAQVARLSREQLSYITAREQNRLGDLLDWASPALSADFHRARARGLKRSGDYAGARDELDAAMREQPGDLAALLSSSDLYVAVGDADGAVRDSRAYLKENKTDAAAYGNVILGEAMRGNYAAAIDAIDAAVKNVQFPISDTEDPVAPDVQGFTFNFEFSAQDSDFLLGLRYLKAAFYAMGGDDRFEAELDASDRADADRPYSREAYLLALNWDWLVIRGQEGRDDAKGASPSRADLKDYGVYAIEGALWDRVAATRPEAHQLALRAYEKFRAANAAGPQTRYSRLASWVDKQMRREIPLAPREDGVLNRARDLALQAQELKRGLLSDAVIELAKASAKLSEAIDLLQNMRRTRHLGRREQDLLVRLLLRRADWRLHTDPGDKGGAQEDARAAIAIKPAAVGGPGGERPDIADAYRILAAAAFDEASRKANDDRALELDPYNSEALSDRASLYEAANTKADWEKALALMQRRNRVVSPSAPGFRRVAQLELRLQNYKAAMAAIESAISAAPGATALYVDRRAIELAWKGDKERAALHFVQGLRADGDFQVQTGHNSPALRAYLRAFREAAQLASTDADAAFELQVTIRDLSAFLVSHYGLDEARAFWSSLAQDPLLNDREHELARKETDRLARQTVQ